MNPITVEKLENSTSSVALVNTNGSGQVQTLQNIVNQLANAQKQVTSLTSITTQITALGLTLPSASAPAPQA